MLCRQVPVRLPCRPLVMQGFCSSSQLLAISLLPPFAHRGWGWHQKHQATLPRRHAREHQLQQQTRPRLAAYHATRNLLSIPPQPSSPAPFPQSPITTSPPEHGPYIPPTAGLLSRLPASWVPYAELVRLDKPAGSLYLFFPCLFSTLMAAPLSGASPSSVLATSALFLAGAIVMRGAGCTINDLWDRNLDRLVARTRLRPVARGAVSPARALVFTAAQLLAGLALLLQFPPACFFYAAPSLLFVAVYPLAKRVTHYAQLVLGVTFSWGAIVGFPAVGVDLLRLASPPSTSAPASALLGGFDFGSAGGLAVADPAALAAAGLLYLSNVAWTVLYDIIYAHMDIRDDAKAGIKSIALKHEANTKKGLTGLAMVQVALLAGAGIASGAGPAFFVGSCGGTLVTLGVMIRRVNLKSVEDCWWWFVNGCWITGGVISAGLAVDYLLRCTLHDRESRDAKATLSL